MRVFSSRFCAYACGIIAALDGKVSPEESAAVIAGLSCGVMGDEQHKSVFLQACQSVHAHGIEKALEKLRLAIHSGKHADADSFITTSELIALLQAVASGSGSESATKAELLNRVTNTIVS